MRIARPAKRSPPPPPMAVLISPAASLKDRVDGTAEHARIDDDLYAIVLWALGWVWAMSRPAIARERLEGLT